MGAEPYAHEHEYLNDYTDDGHGAEVVIKSGPDEY